MKHKYSIVIMAGLAICGCQVMDLDTRTSESKPFTAIVEDQFGDTKTSLDEHGNVLWKQGDQVSIFAGSTVNEQYQVTDSSDGRSAASLDKLPSSGNVEGSGIANNVAFYPYSSTASISNSGGSYVIGDIVLPSTQIYAEGSFGNGAFPMCAVTSSSTDNNLKFKNILGGLKLQLKGTASIASISITGNNGETLCGAAEVTAANGATPSISLSDASKMTVTLDCGEGVQLNASNATSFVIALPPMTFAGGFTVTVEDTEDNHMLIKTTKSQTIARSGILKMPEVNYHSTANKPFTIISTGSTSVTFAKVGDPYAINLEYRKGDDGWADYTIGTSVDLADGESLQFRAGSDGNPSFSKDGDNYYIVEVSGDGNIIASGNIMSLLDATLERNTMPGYAFYALFAGCKITDASDLVLPATTLAESCYMFMFNACASLAQAPDLPATTLAGSCYRSMFQDCKSLVSAPALPATTLSDNCYNAMFGACTSLVSAPALPAATLVESCYMWMFYNCTSLVSAPALPATAAPAGCYESMFRNCYSLVSAPELPATTIGSRCYLSMFENCTSLVKAPDLPAVTLEDNCYNSMFYGCTKLNYVKALFTTTPSSSYTSSWLSGVSTAGTFVKSKDATWNVTGSDGIPSGWTVETY